MEQSATLLVMLKVAKTYLEKLEKQCFSLETMTCLHKIIHRPCCEGFFILESFFFSGTTTYHHRRKHISTHGQEAYHKVESKHYWPSQLSCKLATLAKLFLARPDYIQAFVCEVVLKKLMKLPETNYQLCCK